MYKYRGKIVNVVDGDTVDAIIDVGFCMTTAQRLRLYGVNTPELRSKDGKTRAAAIAAKYFTENTLKDKFVIIETHKADAFGRYLAKIWLDEVDVGEDFMSFNTELIARGYAVPYMQDEGAL